MRIFIEGGHLIPMSGDGGTIIEDGAVLIDGDRIAAVGKAADLGAEKAGADTVVSARGRAILPGFVNTHTHLVGALSKALTEDVPTFGGPFRIALGMHENVVGFDEVYLPGIVHGVEMLKTGTTTINEMWWHQPQSARIVETVGLRAIIAPEIREVDSSKIGFGRFEREWDRDLFDKGVDEAIELLENWNGKADGRISVRVGPDGPDRLKPDSMGELGALAKKYGVGLHTHLCAVPGEAEFMEKLWGKKSIPLLKELDMLSPDFIGAHCVYMDDEDIQIMVETGAAMSHTAFLVGKRGYYPPMDKVYATGMKAGLGSDWLSNDMFNVMRSAIVIARVLYGNTFIREGRDVLKMATIDAARALNIHNEVGSLEVGKKADIMLVDTTTASLNPLRTENLITNLVYNASGRDVTDVFVDGEHMVKDQVLTRFDEAEAIAEAQKVAGAVWERARPLFEAEGLS